MAALLQSGTSLTDSFVTHWAAMQVEVRGSDVGGPLDAPADRAGIGLGGHLQRLITHQREQIAADRLHREITEQLPPTHPERMAWLSVDRLSSQFIPSWPSPELD